MNATITFRANESTHANRRWADGLEVVEVVAHGTYRTVTKGAQDTVSFAVRLADGRWEWATPREIGREHGVPMAMRVPASA